MVLTVGWWLRDWDVLDMVHERLHRRYGNDIEMIVVTRQANRRTGTRPCACWKASPSTTLVRSTAGPPAAVPPLTDATANNALLEALACGTPVVATDIGGIRYYAGQGPAAVLTPPGDAAAAAEAGRTAPRRTGTAAHALRRALARERAELFAWPVSLTRFAPSTACWRRTMILAELWLRFAVPVLLAALLARGLWAPVAVELCARWLRDNARRTPSR